MKAQIFLIFVLFIVRTSATSYRKGEDLNPNEVELLFQEETPSQINCALRCSLKKGDFVYNEGKCTCFLYIKDKTMQSGVHPKTLTGVFYEKENVCLSGNGGCHRDARCTNNIGTTGAISCTCKPGFSGNGLTCTDVNECLVNNGDCDVNANCVNTIGSRTCICKTGYKGSGLTCTLPCQMLDTELYGARITSFQPVKSWNECGIKCVGVRACVQWRWYTPSFYHVPDREKCVLYSSNTGTKTVEKMVSGVKGCVA